MAKGWVTQEGTCLKCKVTDPRACQNSDRSRWWPIVEDRAIPSQTLGEDRSSYRYSRSSLRSKSDLLWRGQNCWAISTCCLTVSRIRRIATNPKPSTQKACKEPSWHNRGAGLYFDQVSWKENFQGCSVQADLHSFKLCQRAYMVEWVWWQIPQAGRNEQQD